MLERLILAFSPNPVRTACSTHFSLITGSMPGMPASTNETWALGSAPNSVEAPENSLDLDRTWACTSRPITTSHSPVWPLMNLDVGDLDAMDLDSCALMPPSTSWQVCDGTRRPVRSPDRRAALCLRRRPFR